MKRIISWVIRFIPRKYLQLISPLALRILGLFYRGKGVQCPVCETEFRKFLPYGRGKAAREQALCPSCQALERHRLMWLFLKQETPFFEKPLRVLHIAPEVCFIHRFERMKNLDYITADLESPLAQIHMDIHQMPFEAGAFDVVFCNHVMEHVTDDLQAMGEILRVLRPQGWAIIQSPMDYSLVTTFEDPAIQSAQARFEAYGQEDHVRLYGLDYPERLRKAGFEVTERQYAQELPPDQVQQYALPKDEILYFCRKPA